MENKKIAIILSSIAVLLFVVVAFIFMYEPARNAIIKQQKQEKKVEEITGDLPELNCEYENDKEAYKDAITKKDVNLCSCIDEEKLLNTCKQASMNVMFYNQALQQLDETLCEKINSDIQKDACHSVVQSSIKQFEKEDPEYLAKIYAQSHNEKAIGELEKITQQDKENIDAYITLALSYAEKGLSEQEQGRDQTTYVNKALQAVEDAKQIDDKNSEVYRVEGYAYEIKPDLKMAKKAYNKSLEINDKNILAYTGLGHVYSMLGENNSAFENFEKASSLDVSNLYIPIYANLCRMGFAHSNDHENAIKNCKIVIDSDTTDVFLKSDAYQILAAVFMGDNNLAQARGYLLQAKTLTPNNPNLYNAFSRLNLREKKYDTAEMTANQAIKFSPTKASSYLALARALYMQERYKESNEALQKGLMLLEDDVSLIGVNKFVMQNNMYSLMAINYRNIGNIDKMKEYQQKIIK